MTAAWKCALLFAVHTGARATWVTPRPSRHSLHARPPSSWLTLAALSWLQGVDKKGNPVMYDLENAINFSVFPGLQVCICLAGLGFGQAPWSGPRMPQTHPRTPQPFTHPHACTPLLLV